jgi:mannose-6-phosphate isomerase-like protein (cupin superfamily)
MIDVTDPAMRVLHGATSYTAPGAAPTHWVDHLRTSHMSLGTYSIPANNTDDQGPHSEDEVYIVVSGKATLDVDGQLVAVGSGSVVFVRAEVPHSFTAVEQDLTVLVLFAPPYSGRG